MTRDEAISIFGSHRATAEALGASTQAIYKWPEVLTRRIEDRVMGAAVRLGKVNHEHNGKNLKRPRPKPKRAP